MEKPEPICTSHQHPRVWGWSRREAETRGAAGGGVAGQEGTDGWRTEGRDDETTGGTEATKLPGECEWCLCCYPVWCSGWNWLPHLGHFMFYGEVEGRVFGALRNWYLSVAWPVRVCVLPRPWLSNTWRFGVILLPCRSRGKLIPFQAFLKETWGSYQNF